MAKRIKIGDIIEIKTHKGLVYAQYTHEHKDPPRMGSLIRVLPGFYDKIPDNLIEIVSQKHKFQTFVPLQKSVNIKLVKIVSNIEVPKQFQKFPIFRNGVVDPKTKKVEDWWFWDGKKEWKVGKITEEQKKMPILQCVTIPALINKIESNWSPENDPYT